MKPHVETCARDIHELQTFYLPACDSTYWHASFKRHAGSITEFGLYVEREGHTSVLPVSVTAKAIKAVAKDFKQVTTLILIALVSFWEVISDVDVTQLCKEISNLKRLENLALRDHDNWNYSFNIIEQQMPAHDMVRGFASTLTGNKKRGDACMTRITSRYMTRENIAATMRHEEPDGDERANGMWPGANRLYDVKLVEELWDGEIEKGEPVVQVTSQVLEEDVKYVRHENEDVLDDEQ